MALKVNITSQGGVDVVNAYVRIEAISIRKNWIDGKYYMTLGTKVYKDATEAKKTPDGAGVGGAVAVSAPNYELERCEYDLVLKDNAWVQGYAYLKTLAKYAGSSDL